VVDLEASLARLRETDWKGWSFSEWISIPPDFWHSEKINWTKCLAEGRDATFALIQIETVELLTCFPPPQTQAADVVRVANDLIAVELEGDESTARNLRGRPSFNWESFHVEIAMRIKFNSFPEKQEALIVDMQEWCERHWHRQVGRSTLLQKIKRYYDALAHRSKRAT
jgi:hypothetical protein